MKKGWKRLSILVAVLVCGVFALSACSSNSNTTTAAPAATEAAGGTTQAAAPSGDVRTLTLSIGSPEGSDNYYKYKAFADALAELSGGTLVVEIYSSGTLATDGEALSALMGNSVDCAHVLPSIASGTIKDLAIMDLPCTFSYPTPEDTDKLVEFDAAIHETLTEIYNDYGLHFIGLNSPCNAVIVTTYGQVTKPEDCAGQPFRTAGRWLGKLLEQWGASATTLDMSELTTAFERGTVTGTLTAYGVVGSNKIYEVAPYITYFHATNNVAMFVMSGSTWDSLTEEQQGWVNEAAEAFLTGGMAVSQEYYTKYREEFEAAEGVSVVDLTEEQEAKFFENVDEIYEEIKAECTEKGIKLMEQIDEFNGK